MSSDLHADGPADVDEIFRKVGRFGRYQKIQAFQMYIAFVPVAFNILGIIFLISSVPMQCQPMANISLTNVILSSNSQIVYKQCDVEVHTNGSVTDHLPCDNGYFYPKGKYISLKSEWDLVCDKENLAELIITSYNIGKLVGCYSLPTFADKYGRKPMFIITHLLLSAVNIANTFSPTYLFYLGLKSLAGFLESGMAVTCPIMLAELFPTENRTMVMIFGGIVWALSVMLIALVGYILEPFGWRYLNLFIGLMSVYAIVQFWTFNESLRWLLARGKWARADAIIKTICRTNKVEYHQIAPLLKYRHKLQTDENERTEVKSVEEMKMIPVKKDFVNHDPPKKQRKEKLKEMSGLIYIFCSPVLRKILLVCMYIWFVNALVYYGLYMMLSLSDNKFLSFFLNGVMELVAHFFTIKLIFRLGRKRSCALFQTMTSLSIITAVILTYFKGDNYGMQIGATIFSLIGMFSISASFLCIWLYTPEMFPTNVRNVGLATSSTASRIGNMLAPFSNTLANYVSWGPGLVFGVLCLLCNVFIVLLPETCHRQLPQTVEDVEEWQRERREKKRNKNKVRKHKEKPEEENNYEFL